jgi:hypothetical protein
LSDGPGHAWPSQAVAGYCAGTFARRLPKFKTPHDAPARARTACQKSGNPNCRTVPPTAGASPQQSAPGLQLYAGRYSRRHAIGNALPLASSESPCTGRASRVGSARHILFFVALPPLSKKPHDARPRVLCSKFTAYPSCVPRGEGSGVPIGPLAFRPPLPIVRPAFQMSAAACRVSGLACRHPPTIGAARFCLLPDGRCLAPICVARRAQAIRTP